jgi:hypothetical protein
LRKIEAGSLVMHRTLGTGKVVAVEATALHVYFPVRETRYAAKLRWPAAGVFLSHDEPAPDPLLEGLNSFALDPASGRYALSTSFIGQDEAVARFLADHPAGFPPVEAPAKGASRLDRRQRWRAASAAWAETLGGGKAAALLDDGKDAALVSRLLRVAEIAAVVPGMMDLESLADSLQPGAETREFLVALTGYLSVPSPARARFDRLGAAVHALGLPAEAAWAAVTFFPFVAVPARHVLLLPRSACAGASCLGWDLRYTATPNWATYTRLRDLSCRLLERLAPSGAQDHADVETFLHATGSRRAATAARTPRVAVAASAAKARRPVARRAR